ncbi:endo alpha-1,4 polygalactosaminidase [Saccharopolyspora pogona]|uniref:endo alpha-1,4 polygalactosaminidase n=1 Tax=Saccharopolyspora pogona TaxID=333966 RepID=UPI001CC22F5C|nr:endo alpha-1,4 polygalactosaminidase [Saccharopolyspora pogona]
MRASIVMEAEGMKSAVRSSFWVVAVAVTAIAGCSLPPGSAEEPRAPATAREVADPDAAREFPAAAAVDYQLGGAYPPPAGFGVVVRDSTVQPAPGVYNICYVSGFQTQPAERELWLRDRRDMVLFGDDGLPVVDEEWPDELIVDTSTADKRRRLTEIEDRTIKSCSAAGFDAVEIDNLDSYSRSDGALTAEDNLAFAAELARVAHGAGLLIGQKNAAELSSRAKEQAGFDFAVAEECLQYDECADYTAVYDDRVIGIEYTDTLAEPPAETCARPDRLKATVIRDRQLVAIGDEGYFYFQC